MATSVVIPNENDYEISYFINNQGNKALRYKNCGTITIPKVEKRTLRKMEKEQTIE